MVLAKASVPCADIVFDSMYAQVFSTILSVVCPKMRHRLSSYWSLFDQLADLKIAIPLKNLKNA